MLVQYKTDVLDQGPQACLPCNLSDHWLTVLQQCLDDSFDGSEQPRHPGADALVLATVITLVEGKGKHFQMPMDAIFGHYEFLKMELALEEMHRKTNCKYEPATLKTIFTNRNVNVWREGEPPEA